MFNYIIKKVDTFVVSTFWVSVHLKGVIKGVILVKQKNTRPMSVFKKICKRKNLLESYFFVDFYEKCHWRS
jgi:hypothetical protein